MKVYNKYSSHSDYTEEQIKRSENKFQFCKVSIHDAIKYKKIISKRERIISKNENSIVGGPIACLGTRNGREVDIFRTVFFGGNITRRLVAAFERRTHSFVSQFPTIEGMNRSDKKYIESKSVIGVELNPSGERKDVLVASFQEMPDEWDGKFNIVYSNAFDQSYNPYKTAKEWERIVKDGGYIIFCFTEGNEPSRHDPVGGIYLNDVLELFSGDIIYYMKKGSQNNYSEVILKY